MYVYVFVCVLMRDIVYKLSYNNYIYYSDPPVFVHDNGTFLRELKQGEDHSLYCNISSANPTPHLKLIIEAKHKTNVDFMVKYACPKNDFKWELHIRIFLFIHALLPKCNSNAMIIGRNIILSKCHIKTLTM